MVQCIFIDPKIWFGGGYMSEHYKKLPSTLYEDIVSEIKYKSDKKRKARESRKKVKWNE
jgi:hypothetical protein